MSERKPIVGILIISTLKYKQFVIPLVDSIKKYFLPDNMIVIHLFADAIIPIEDSGRVSISQHPIEPYKFPFATLYRYKIFCHYEKYFHEDYLFYLDADMLVVDYIGNEILNSLTVVHHPGFFKSNGWGSMNVDERSTAFVPVEKRKRYVAGGFNGAQRNNFISICYILDKNISMDEENGIIAEHNDESHLNHLISTMNGINSYSVLEPSYCMVEQEYLRAAWGISELHPKIIALAKNHEEIRS